MDDKELEKTNKGIFDFLIELNNDRRKNNIILIVLVFVLIALVIGMAVGMFFMSIHCQNKIEAMAEKSEKRLYEFISEYDFNTSYNLDTGTNIGSDTSGNINFNQR